MTDTVSKSRRSEIMSRIHSKDTAPEMLVRRLVWGLGYRYRLHARGLPGRPDLVFPSRKKVVFVHGCFWHMHRHGGTARVPKSRVKFWLQKLSGNAERDANAKRALTRLGWSSIVVWECQTANRDRLAGRLKAFLGGAA